MIQIYMKFDVVWQIKLSYPGLGGGDKQVDQPYTWKTAREVSYLCASGSEITF